VKILPDCTSNVIAFSKSAGEHVPEPPSVLRTHSCSPSHATDTVVNFSFQCADSYNE